MFILVLGTLQATHDRGLLGRENESQHSRKFRVEPLIHAAEGRLTPQKWHRTTFRPIQCNLELNYRGKFNNQGPHTPKPPLGDTDD